MRDADYFWMVIFLVLAYMSVRLSKRYFGTWFSPVSMYVGMNALSMAGYHLKWLAYHDISLATHALLLMSMAAFVVGMQFALGGRFRPESLNEQPKRDLSNLDLFFYTTVSLATVGWLLASFILIKNFGLGRLINNIWMLQTEFQMQYIGYMNMMGILVLPIYTIRRLYDQTRPFDILLVCSALFGLLLAGIKSYLITSIVASMIIWAVLRPSRFRPAYLLGALGAMLSFFIAYSARIDIFVAATGDASQKFAMFQRPYAYFTGSWPALESLVSGIMPPLPYWGYITFQPLWKMLGFLGIFDVLTRYLPSSNTGVTPFNVYSFVGEVYWDWGWSGAAIYSFLLGFISTRLYLRARLCVYWGHVLIYGIIGYGIFMSSFNYIYHFNVMLMLSFVYVFAFVLLRRGALVDGRHRD